MDIRGNAGHQHELRSYLALRLPLAIQFESGAKQKRLANAINYAS